MSTVKVKILVGVTSKKKWAAVGGWSRDIDTLKEATAIDEDGDQVLWTWVTADVPAPSGTIETVAGDVSEEPVP